MSQKVTVGDFFHAMWSDWVARLSGPLSVPAAAMSYWVSNDIGKGIFAFTAFACVWVTAYRLWKPLEEQIRPKLKLSYAADKTFIHLDGSDKKQTYIRVTNESKQDVDGAQVIVQDCRFRRKQEDRWEPSHVIATINMSWCSRPDSEPGSKFGAIQLPPGDHLLDFITAPELGTHVSGTRVRGFVLENDYRHVNPPFFHNKGMYKFLMQVSSLDGGQADHLTLLVHWTGKDFSVRTDDGTILEPRRQFQT